MELRPSSEVASRSAIKDFPSNLWNSKIHYRVYKNFPLDRYTEPDESSPSDFSQIHFNIILTFPLKTILTLGFILLTSCRSQQICISLHSVTFTSEICLHLIYSLSYLKSSI
jgi:hypothetical protein